MTFFKKYSWKIVIWEICGFRSTAMIWGPFCMFLLYCLCRILHMLHSRRRWGSLWPVSTRILMAGLRWQRWRAWGNMTDFTGTHLPYKCISGGVHLKKITLKVTKNKTKTSSISHFLSHSSAGSASAHRRKLPLVFQRVCGIQHWIHGRKLMSIKSGFIGIFITFGPKSWRTAIMNNES